MKVLKKILILGSLLFLTTGIIMGCSKEDSLNPIAKISIKGYGTITAELYPEQAPNTVDNFIELSTKGFYNGLILHRVVKDFVVQGGDPEGLGIGGPGYFIPGEFSENGFKKNTISHTKGVLSMARGTDYDSAGSQFFIVAEDAKYLDNNYAGFGKVIEGIDIVEKIQSVDVDENDKPIQDIIIESIVIENNNYKIGKVEKLK